MMVSINVPKEIMDEINKDNPFPWVQYVHPNGLVQIGDKNNKEVSLFLLIKLGLAIGQEITKNG